MIQDSESGYRSSRARVSAPREGTGLWANAAKATSNIFMLIYVQPHRPNQS
jgi:hypothetical protein